MLELEAVNEGEPETLRVAVAESEGLLVVLPVAHALLEPVVVTDEQALEDIVIEPLLVLLTLEVPEKVSKLDNVPIIKGVDETIEVIV